MNTNKNNGITMQSSRRLFAAADFGRYMKNKIIAITILFIVSTDLFALAPDSKLKRPHINTKNMFSDQERQIMKGYLPSGVSLENSPFFIGVMHSRDTFEMTKKRIIKTLRRYGLRRIAIELNSVDHLRRNFHFFAELARALEEEGFEINPVDDDSLYLESNILIRLYELVLSIIDDKDWFDNDLNSRKVILKRAIPIFARAIDTYRDNYRVISGDEAVRLRRMVLTYLDDYASPNNIRELELEKDRLERQLKKVQVKKSFVMYEKSMGDDALITGTGHMLQILAAGDRDSYPGILIDSEMRVLRDMFEKSLPDELEESI